MRISDWSSDVCSSDLDAIDEIRRNGIEVDGGAARKAGNKATTVDEDQRAVGTEVAQINRRNAGAGCQEVGVGAGECGRTEHRILEIGRASGRERWCQYG